MEENYHHSQKLSPSYKFLFQSRSNLPRKTSSLRTSSTYARNLTQERRCRTSRKPPKRTTLHAPKHQRQRSILGLKVKDRGSSSLNCILVHLCNKPRNLVEVSNNCYTPLPQFLSNHISMLLYTSPPISI